MSDMCLAGRQWYVITYLMKTRLGNKDKESIRWYQPRHVHKVSDFYQNVGFVLTGHSYLIKWKIKNHL